MTDTNKVGANYEAFRAQFGRFRLCGLEWDIYDRLLDAAGASTPEAFGLACEELANGLRSIRPNEAGKLYHFAQFQEVNDLERKRRLQAQCRAAFWDAAPKLAWQVSRLDVIDGDRKLPAILVEKPSTPPNSDPLILLNGLDSAKEVELLAFATRFLNSGVDRCVLVDGPGQAEARWEGNVCLERFETVIPAVMEGLRATGRAVTHAMVFGVSFGGFLAMQSAQTVPAVRGAVCFSCATDWNHLATLPPRLTALFRLAAGVQTEEQWQSFLQRDLQLPGRRPLCPVLIAHGTQDVIMPIAASRKLAKDYPSDVYLIELEDGHVFLHHVEEVLRQSAEWLLRLK